MQVDGVGDVQLVDSWGFPVVWIGAAGCPIGQDPSQGGTNCYGPGDVLSDPNTGAQYQIGGDWHVYPMGSGDSSSSAPPDNSAPSSPSTPSGYVPPTSAGDTGGGGDNGSSGGFGAPNPVGGYGPYATPDPPILTDLGTYVAGGELYDHQVDQYGNDYYTDLGPAPAQSAPAAPPPTVGGTPRSGTPPTVPSVRPPSGPSLGAGTPAVATTPAPGEPVAADGQRLSGQSAITQAAFRALYGANAAAAWVAQHNAAIGAPQSPATVAAPTVPAGGGRPSAPVQPGGTHGGPTTHTGTTPPAISATGNPTQFGHQVITWLGTASFISGVPNAILVAGGAVAYSMLRQRRRF